MHKFTVKLRNSISNPKSPYVYIVWFGEHFYIHKSKEFNKGYEYFLNSVYKGTLDKFCSDYFKNVVALCKKYPALHKIEIEPVSTGKPQYILRKEKVLLQSYKKDPKCLNNFDKYQLIPEWCSREIYQERCTDCIKSGIIEDKKKKFRFCPNCGRLIKK